MNVLCNREARMELHNLLIYITALLHILLCRSLYIRQEMRTLEG